MHAPFDASRISLRAFFPQGRIFPSSTQTSPNPKDIVVQTLCSDSRRVREGDLFVALPGLGHDGHEFAAEAARNGAAAILSERLLPVALPQCVVPDTRHAHARLCLEMAGRPEQRMRVTGVAGTLGKTVTSLLMASILKAAGRRVGLTSSIGYCDSEDLGLAHETTPRSPQMASWLGRMAENGCQDAVLEIDAAALADRRASAIPLHTAVLTNLATPARDSNVEAHTFEAYCRQKLRLFEQLEDGGVIILNADDVPSMDFLPRLKQNIITVGMRAEADITAKVLERNRGDQQFLLRFGGESVPVRTRMLGDFHVENCLLAAAMGLRLNLSIEEIVRGLEALDRVPGRLERIVAGQSCGVFVDASRQTTTLANNLRELRKVTPGRVICVLGSHPSDDEAVCAARGRVVEHGADLGVITGHRPGAKASLRIMHDVLDGWQNPKRAHLLPSRDAAIAWAVEQATADDTVFVAGAAADERIRIQQHLREQQVFVEPKPVMATEDEPEIYRIDDYRFPESGLEDPWS